MLGPPGAGHGSAALAVHGQSTRARASLIRVDPGGDGLAAGLTAAARGGGTLHVTRVELLGREDQARLLSSIEGPEAPGGLVASSEVDLLGADRPAAFDEELAYALNVATVGLPALADRAEDLEDLARHCVADAAARRGRDLDLAPGALERLRDHDWPGNLEELALVLARAALVARGDRIEASDLGLGSESADSLPLGDRRLATVERALIERVLQEADGNRSLAARQLGVNRSTLYNKLRAWGLH